jgi:dihydropteroate synthase
MLVGTSRKSFIGKILDDAPAHKRLQGSVATAAIAVWNGANIVRVHDVKATVETLKVVDKIKGQL